MNSEAAPQFRYVWSFPSQDQDNSQFLLISRPRGLNAPVAADSVDNRRHSHTMDCPTAAPDTTKAAFVMLSLKDHVMHPICIDAQTPEGIQVKLLVASRLPARDRANAEIV